MDRQFKSKNWHLTLNTILDQTLFAKKRPIPSDGL